jgi:hypothetical protein
VERGLRAAQEAQRGLDDAVRRADAALMRARDDRGRAQVYSHAVRVGVLSRALGVVIFLSLWSLTVG